LIQLHTFTDFCLPLLHLDLLHYQVVKDAGGEALLDGGLKLDAYHHDCSLYRTVL
jgi:hypothetical protein